MSDFKKYLNNFVFETVLPGSGKTIKFHPITTGQIKKLLLYEASDDPETIEGILDELISECVTTEDFDIGDLYLQDRFYLLVEIRRATKGSYYQFQTICSKCESQSQQNIDLGELPLKKLLKLEIEATKISVPPHTVSKRKKPKGPSISLEEVVDKPVVAPSVTKHWNVIHLNDNISLKMDIVTRTIQRQANEIATKALEGDERNELNEFRKDILVATVTTAMCIKEIITPDGIEADVSLQDKIYLLDNITQLEMEKITNWFINNDFGLEFKMDIVCQHCGEKEVREIPFENFFY